jgi:hypothetical protein
MKFLSCGWQYMVYDLGNGRVRKVKHTPWFQHGYIALQLLPKLFSFRISPLSFLNEVKSEVHRVNKAERESNLYIKKILNQIPHHLLGNPLFIQEGIYEQDKVTMLEDLYKRGEVRSILESYIKLIHTLWGYGIAETVFRFTANNGIDKDGQIIQTDFGEITNSKEEALELIKHKTWERFSKYLSEEDRVFYLQRMEEEMTLTKLESLWGKSLVDSKN